jgi:hypothetical protein
MQFVGYFLDRLFHELISDKINLLLGPTTVARYGRFDPALNDKSPTCLLAAARKALQADDKLFQLHSRQDLC